MNCPPEIAKVLLEILHRGVLATRFRGWQDDATGAALEADHVHNLPHLLLNFSRSNLDWYWKVERPSYIHAHQRLGNQQTSFDDLWAQLESVISNLSEG